MSNPLPRLPRMPGKPSTPTMTECEANIGGTWRTISAEQAIATNEQDGRCLECKQPVRVHKGSLNGMSAHFEHRDKNVSCPLIPQR